jgi:hypothetical protein
VAGDPTIIERLQAQDGSPLAYFAGAGNTAAVRLMLDLDFDGAIRADRQFGRAR